MARMYVLPGRRYCKVADEASASRFANGHPQSGNIRAACCGDGVYLLDGGTVVHNSGTRNCPAHGRRAVRSGVREPHPKALPEEVGRGTRGPDRRSPRWPVKPRRGMAGAVLVLIGDLDATRGVTCGTVLRARGSGEGPQYRVSRITHRPIPTGASLGQPEPGLGRCSSDHVWDSGVGTHNIARQLVVSVCSVEPAKPRRLRHPRRASPQVSALRAHRDRTPHAGVAGSNSARRTCREERLGPRRPVTSRRVIPWRAWPPAR
jgi:hypothetical protein